MPVLGRGSKRNHSEQNWLQNSDCAAALIDINLSTLVFIVTGSSQNLTVTFATALNTMLGTECSYCGSFSNSETRQTHLQLLVRSSLERERNDLHTVDLGMDSVTQRFVAWSGDHWKGWVIQPEITLRHWCGMLSHAWVSMNMQYHKAEVVFLWQPAVWYQNIQHFPCLISFAAQLRCPLRCVSVVIPVEDLVMRAATCSWNIQVKFSVVAINHGHPCLTL